MIKKCENCGGGIFPTNVAYSYAGPVCSCVRIQPAPAPDKALWQRSYEREIGSLEDEIERLRDALISCRSSVRLDLTNYERVLNDLERSDQQRSVAYDAVSKERTRLFRLLEQIDALA